MEDELVELLELEEGVPELDPLDDEELLLELDDEELLLEPDELEGRTPELVLDDEELLELEELELEELLLDCSTGSPPHPASASDAAKPDIKTLFFIWLHSNIGVLISY